MTARNSVVQADDYVILRLASGSLKVVQCTANHTQGQAKTWRRNIDTGKFGSFPSSYLLGRPYYHTYEVQEKQQNESHPRIRIVPPAELSAEAAASEASLAESRDAGTDTPSNGAGYDLVAEDGQVLMKNNRLIVDDATRQALSHEEIEELKKTAAGKDIVEKILANHTALDEKTAFSRAKYTLRKTKKYLKRFVALPMELGYLIEYILEKEPGRIMELREESLGLLGSWSNAHFAPPYDSAMADEAGEERVLVVDDAGGLVVAAIAERKGILRPDQHVPVNTNGQKSTDVDAPASDNNSHDRHVEHRDFPTPAINNTITLIHAATQPNVSLLKYFGYDSNTPDAEHPLHTHFKPLSWLQLIHPDEDPLYCEPPMEDPSVVASWKSGKRGAYYKKRRRWERCKSIVDEARAGGFDALVVASHMDPQSIFARALPLLRGGAHVVVYSPNIDPLVKLMDLYSKDRRAAYMQQLAKYPDEEPDKDDFPLDPRLLLAPTLQTSRIRDWQVLPGRTHPMMTSRGGSEGYIFTARRVVPLEGGIAARGNFSKSKRKDVGVDNDAMVS